MTDPALMNLAKQVEDLRSTLGIGTVYIDGPPDLWCEDSYLSDSPMMSTADMSAIADPAWVAAVTGITADNGAIDIAAFDYTLLSGITPYWPVWVVPTMGRQVRVVLDDAEITSDPVGGSVVNVGAGLQNGTFDFEASGPGGWTDDFEVGVNAGLVPVDKYWLGYGTLYPAEAPFQTPPLQSLTQEESASIYYGAYRIDPHQPYMTVTVAWNTGLSGPDMDFALTGLRVERS